MDEEDKPREYWVGVNETLDLIRDYVEYKKNNPNEGKSVKAFLLDSMDQITKYTQPRLRDLIDLPFLKENKKKEE